MSGITFYWNPEERCIAPTERIKKVGLKAAPAELRDAMRLACKVLIRRPDSATLGDTLLWLKTVISEVSKDAQWVHREISLSSLMNALCGHPDLLKEIFNLTSPNSVVDNPGQIACSELMMLTPQEMYVEMLDCFIRVGYESFTRNVDPFITENTNVSSNRSSSKPRSQPRSQSRSESRSDTAEPANRLSSEALRRTAARLRQHITIPLISDEFPAVVLQDRLRMLDAAGKLEMFQIAPSDVLAFMNDRSVWNSLQEDQESDDGNYDSDDEDGRSDHIDDDIPEKDGIHDQSAIFYLLPYAIFVRRDGTKMDDDFRSWIKQYRRTANMLSLQHTSKVLTDIRNWLESNVTRLARNQLGEEPKRRLDAVLTLLDREIAPIEAYD